MAEVRYYATGADRNGRRASSDILDALAAVRPAWWDHATCRTHPELDWFPDPHDRPAVAAAIEVCLGCPVRQECRDAAGANGERFGIWRAVAMVQRPDRGGRLEAKAG